MMKYIPILHGSPQAWDCNRRPAKGGSNGDVSVGAINGVAGHIQILEVL